MTLKNFYQIIISSFYSPTLYLTVAQKWRHWGLGFLLRFSILLAVISSIMLFISIASMDIANSSSFASLINQIPELKIEKGKASIVNEQIKLPLQIKFLNNNINIITVDLNITDAERYPRDMIIFTSDRVTFNFVEAANISILYDNLFKDKETQIITPESILTLLTVYQKKLLGIIFILGIPVGSLFYFLLILLKSFFYASLASIITKLVNYNLNLQQIVRLAIIVNAPFTIISTLLLFLFFGTNFSSIAEYISNCVYLFYLVFAIRLCGQASKR